MQTTRPQRSSSSRRSFAAGPSNRPAHGRTAFRGPKKKKNFGESIDVSKFIKKAVPLKVKDENDLEVTSCTFADFEFCEQISKNLARKKYIHPTPIQEKSMHDIIKGRDLIGLANTGTGKTGAFLLPLINKTDLDRTQKTLIIAPTRELAQQIDDEYRQFAFGMRLFSAICVGGMPVMRQINDVRRHPNFVIGTPGRLKDLGDRGEIKYSEFTNVVVDEVDQMMDMGFINDIKYILSQMPRERQSLFFSATMPPKIKELALKFLKQPVTVAVKTGTTTDNVEQDIIRVKDPSKKFEELHKLLKQVHLEKVLIFSETKRDVERLTNDLIRAGFKADSIHGDKRQRERQRALNLFREGQTKILVATDVAARGLDIKNITHVINYTIPQTYDDYTHRIGRTGRGENMGVALTFV